MRGLMTMFVTGSLSVALAIPAHGDPQVDDPSADYASAHGTDICDFIAQHPTGQGIVLLLANTVNDSGMSLHDADAAVGAAVRADCPQYLGLLRVMTQDALY
jgi:hypothetical protein